MVSMTGTVGSDESLDSALMMASSSKKPALEVSGEVGGKSKFQALELSILNTRRY